MKNVKTWIELPFICTRSCTNLFTIKSFCLTVRMTFHYGNWIIHNKPSYKSSRIARTQIYSHLYKNDNIQLTVILTFNLWSRSDIVSIKKLTLILKIIAQCDFKHIMTLMMKPKRSVFKVLTYIIISTAASLMTGSDTICLDLQNCYYYSILTYHILRYINFISIHLQLAHFYCRSRLRYIRFCDLMIIEFLYLLFTVCTVIIIN